MIRTFMAAAALLLLLPGAAAAQKMCDQVRTNTTTAPAPLTEKVAAIPNKRIYICGYMIVRNGTDPGDLQFQLMSGTGRDCASNKNILIPQMAVPASGVLINRTAYAAGEKTPPGHAVCLQVFGTSGTLVSIFYWAQF